MELKYVLRRIKDHHNDKKPINRVDVEWMLAYEPNVWAEMRVKETALYDAGMAAVEEYRMNTRYIDREVDSSGYAGPNADPPPRPAKRSRFSLQATNEQQQAEETSNPSRLTTPAIDRRTMYRFYVDNSEPEITVNEMANDEIPIGVWSQDPYPQRLVTARIIFGQTLAYTLRNFDKKFDPMPENTHHTPASDVSTCFSWEHVSEHVQFNKPTLSAGADETQRALLDFVLTRLIEEGRDKSLVWKSVEDMRRNRTLGQVLGLQHMIRFQFDSTIGYGDPEAPGELAARTEGMATEIMALARTAGNIVSSSGEDMFPGDSVASERDKHKKLWDAVVSTLAAFTELRRW